MPIKPQDAKPGHLIFEYLERFWEWPRRRTFKNWMMYIAVIYVVLMFASGILALIFKNWNWLILYFWGIALYFILLWNFETWFVVRCIVIYQWLMRRKNWRAYHVKVIVKDYTKYTSSKENVRLFYTFEFVPPRAKFTWVEIPETSQIRKVKDDNK